MKIKDLVLNQTDEITLVVLSATPRETKTKKPYLTMELFDGFDRISANYWDWGGKNIPEADTILTLTVTKGEYMGTPQLTVKNMRINKEASIWDFAPQSGKNIEEVYSQALLIIDRISDPDLNKLCAAIFKELAILWKTVPAANSIHHAYYAGTLIHSVSVANIAASIAWGVSGANIDLCTVGGLLHDLGKLFTYRLSGASICMSDEGMLFEHTFLGANFISNFADHHLDTDDEYVSAKLEMLMHIVLSHHGKREYGAAVSPASLEAHIVNYADGIDAIAEEIREASSKVSKVKWTNKIWPCDNKPHLATQYVEAVMRNKTEQP